MEFDFTRYGVDISTLKVYLRSLLTDNFTTESLIWVLEGQQGKDWKQGFALIQPNGQYQMIIEAVRGKYFEGDIAIDDLGILPTGACELQPKEADPIRTFQKQINCGFETDICQWQDDLTGQLNWTRHTDRTPTAETGPESGKER